MSQKWLSLTACAMMLISLLIRPPAARADSFEKQEANIASGAGNLLFLGVGTLLPLFEDGSDGKEHALRTADAVITSTLITEGLKRLVREKRPDDAAPDSFPSGHATAAFAVATMQSHYHPGQKWLWYGGATLIAASRVQKHRHYIQDVVAGAGVGYLTARYQLKQSRGFILGPFIPESKNGGGMGLAFSANF